MNYQILKDDVAECLRGNLRDSLNAWVSKFSIRHRPVNCLLQLLKQHGLDELPNDVRTLMHTPRNTGADIISQDSGRYKHFDLITIFTREIRKYFSNIPSVIVININVDGLRLSKGSKSQFWPILILIKASFPMSPFLAGLYHGDSKPKDANKFFEPFVAEMVEIFNNGIIDSTKVQVEINAICCDAPARAFIAYVKGHQGYYGCSKCIQKEYQICNRVTFPSVDSELRTDESFRLKQQPQHHLGTSALEKLGIGMVSQIALDYMHLACLGVMKRLIQFWIRGDRNIIFSDQITEKASHKLASMEEYLEDCDRWKATEFRQFLLYTGPVVLICVGMRENLLEHCISLSIAIRILCDPQSCNKSKTRDYAGSLLTRFVSSYGGIYGEHYISYNVHNLIHLPNEVKKFGSLDEFSCFPFENHLQVIKNKISNSGKPLEEIINRIHEVNLSEPNANRTMKDYPIVYCTSRGEIKYLEFDGFIISRKDRDNCCILNDKSVIVVKDIIREHNGDYVRAKHLENIGSLYTKPCDSQILGIFIASLSCIESEASLVLLSVSQIKQKCLKLPYSEQDRTFVIIPILHANN